MPDTNYIISPLPDSLAQNLNAPPDTTNLRLPKSAQVGAIANQLQDIATQLSTLSTGETVSKQDLEAVRQELLREIQGIRAYQEGVYNWVLAIGQQLGIQTDR